MSDRSMCGCCNTGFHCDCDANQKKIEDLETRLAQAERETEELKKSFAMSAPEQMHSHLWIKKCEELEAERDRWHTLAEKAREALERIIAVLNSVGYAMPDGSPLPMTINEIEMSINRDSAFEENIRGHATCIAKEALALFAAGKE